MSLHITDAQVLALSPDPSSTAAGRKLANSKHWKNLGYNDVALWGECQGSALYQVRVQLDTLSVQCSCPSRKQPCKHCLGLLLLAAGTSDSIPTTEPPEWVASWLAKRAASAAKKQEARQAAFKNSEPTAAQKKTAEKRLAQVKDGIDRLDLWLNDLVRNGLGTLETQPVTFWENEARPLVDAQAPGLAARVRRLAAIPNATPDWPNRLLGQLGLLALLTESFHRLDQLDPALQEDVRFLIGWSLKEDEVLARGEKLTDEWLVLGQHIEEVDRGRNQRTWLFGVQSKRSALHQQFAMTNQAFPTSLPVGTRFQATLAFWPSASPQRALIENRESSTTPIDLPLPGTDNIETFLTSVAAELARLPWRDRFLCTLQQVTPLYDDANRSWWVRDAAGQALPLTNTDHWHLLTYSGGHPIDLAAEWNHEQLLPLGIQVAEHYHILGRDM